LVLFSETPATLQVHETRVHSDLKTIPDWFFLTRPPAQIDTEVSQDMDATQPTQVQVQPPGNVDPRRAARESTAFKPVAPKAKKKLVTPVHPPLPTGDGGPTAPTVTTSTSMGARKSSSESDKGLEHAGRKRQHSGDGVDENFGADAASWLKPLSPEDAAKQAQFQAIKDAHYVGRFTVRATVMQRMVTTIVEGQMRNVTEAHVEVLITSLRITPDVDTGVAAYNLRFRKHHHDTLFRLEMEKKDQ
jgi:hypothetical protein